jgi:hypothetical protein
VLPGAISSRRASDGRHAVLGDPQQQIWLIDDPPAEARLGILLPLDDALPQRVAAVMALWRHVNVRRALLDRDLTANRRSRLILGLRALDGRHDGASYRDLARGLFPSARVPVGAAWKTHDLRSRIMRLVADATALRDGGYRKLLLGGPRCKP